MGVGRVDPCLDPRLVLRVRFALIALQHIVLVAETLPVACVVGVEVVNSPGAREIVMERLEGALWARGILGGKPAVRVQDLLDGPKAVNVTGSR